MLFVATLCLICQLTLATAIQVSDSRSSCCVPAQLLRIKWASMHQPQGVDETLLYGARPINRCTYSQACLLCMCRGGVHRCRRCSDQYQYDQSNCLQDYGCTSRVQSDGHPEGGEGFACWNTSDSHWRSSQHKNSRFSFCLMCLSSGITCYHCMSA